MATAASVWVVLDLEQHVQSIHSAEIAALREAVKTPGNNVVRWPLGRDLVTVLASIREVPLAPDSPTAPRAPRKPRES